MPIQNSLASAFVMHYQSLIAFARRRAASAEAAADIVHDAFVRIATLDAPERVLQPQAFFVRMVENLVIDRFREQRAADTVIVAGFASTDEPPDYPSDAARPDLLAQASQTAHRIDMIVAALPPRCREVFLLRKIDGLSHDDIAARLNISRNMVEKHLRRALLAFQNETGDAQPNDDASSGTARIADPQPSASRPRHDDASHHDA
ncbi:sigma-70 family RNA polymerase sigma factor [Paraburkholderia sp.]|uniref:sigma-70 family RNA polymerase sigma factor n=1 Tax=Paraburkholderia sp. TaxID=1926495 RepID=UPI0023A36DD3|nr:sigma-70 family RNA polymerase sigma factor [Paraburkholderia sp.]MDE1178978.1 sigma-70 family RNA polymerase sigma factor [Paraburkholderia sp.]